MKGRAAMFWGPGQALEIRDFPVPEPEPGAVLVRVELCNVCGSDVHAWTGDWDLKALGGRLPTILGHEMAGVIEALGDGIERDSGGTPLGPGDRVVYSYFQPCRRCEACLEGSSVACLGLRMAMLASCEEPPYFVGGFGEYFYLPPAATVVRVPDGLPDDVVAGAGCGLSQMVFGLERAGLRPGERVVIQGAGGLGLYATALARELGAKQVVVLDFVPERLALARRFGADEVVDLRELPTAKDRVRRVRQLTGGYGGHVVAELAGSPAAFDEGLGMTRLGGRLLEIGNVAQGPTVQLDPTRLVFGNRTVLGVSLYEPWALKRALDFLARNLERYPFDALAAEAYPLEEIDRALSDAAARRVPRASVRPWAQGAVR